MLGILSSALTSLIWLSLPSCLLVMVMVVTVSVTIGVMGWCLFLERKMREKDEGGDVTKIRD